MRASIPLLTLLGCVPPDPGTVADHDPADAELAPMYGKADGAGCVQPGSPAADGVLALVNDPGVSAEELDRPQAEGGAGLYRTAAYGIVEARPIADLDELDDVPWVGPVACRALAEYACNVEGRCLQDLRVMTWNLRTFPLTAETEDAVVEILHLEAPDVVGLQEIADVAAFERLMDRLPEYDGFLAEPGPFTRVALAVRHSSVAVLSVEDLFVDDAYAFPRPVLSAKLRLEDGDAFEVAVVHLKASGGESNESRRRAATTRLRSWIDDRRADDAAQLLVIGDYNDELEDPPWQNVFTPLHEPEAQVAFLTRELERAGEVSYVPWARMLDHILVTEELLDLLHHRETAVLELDETWRDDYIDVVSDHRPVASTFDAPVHYVPPAG